MAEETTAADAQATPETEQPDNANGSGQQPDGQQAATAKTFTQDEVDAIVSERLKRATEKAKTEAEKAAEKAKADALKEQGKFEELYKAEAAKAEALEKEKQELLLGGWRKDAAAKHKLPAAWAARLQGATAEEIEADAAELAKTMPKPGAPSINDVGSGGQSSAATISKDEITHLAGVTGLPAKYFEQAGG